MVGDLHVLVWLLRFEVAVVEVVMVLLQVEPQVVQPVVQQVALPVALVLLQIDWAGGG